VFTTYLTSTTIHSARRITCIPATPPLPGLMPKKQKRPLHTRPTTNPHPSLTLTKSTTLVPHGSTELKENRSVASSLHYLRIEEARRSLPRPPPLASVHPSLRNLLDVPETPQPSPRTGMRPAGPPQRRPVPGPATPPSWQLLGSRHAHQTKDSQYSIILHNTSQRFGHERILLPGAKYPAAGSLLDAVLRKLAENWPWHLQFDHYYLASIPIHLKEALLSYIATHASETSLGTANSTLRVLFPDGKDIAPENETYRRFGDSGAEVARLDLGRALGTWLKTTSSLKKELIWPSAPRGSKGSSVDVKAEKSLSELPESWDDADGVIEDGVGPSSLPTPLQELPAMRFSKLLHLSLALSPSKAPSISAASWSSLLSITSHLSTLQSLSLAFWPCPTLTPHAAAVSATLQNPVSRTLPSISYGGTDMYTESESSWREAAGILRKLSRHLYCLRWLDLTGCGAWFEALSWSDTEMPHHNLVSEASYSAIGPDWNGSWRNIDYLALRVGWTPTSPDDSEQSSVSSQACFVEQANTSLSSSTKIAESNTSRNGQGLIKQDWDVEEERGKYLAKKELERFSVIQARAREVARHMRIVRERARGKWMEVGL
jgi:hypothetical protein